MLSYARDLVNLCRADIKAPHEIPGAFIFFRFNHSVNYYMLSMGKSMHAAILKNLAIGRAGHGNY